MTYFSKPGVYKVVFEVIDGDQVSNTTVAILQVNTQLFGSISLVGVGQNNSTAIDRGNSTILNVTANGGSGSYAYQWFEQLPNSTTWVLIPGAINSTFAFNTNSTTEPGVYHFRVSITDINTDPVIRYSNRIAVTVRSSVIYQVLFSETGLPLGTKWYLNLTNGQSFTSTIPSITFLKGNGTYTFNASTSNSSYKLVSTSNSFTVDGFGITVRIAFSPNVYSVVFSEFGIGAGTEWYVNLTNGQSYSSDTPTISFFEPNGTYTYSVEASSHKYVAQGGSFLVEGSATSISVIFASVGYQVSFAETGLPGGAKWYINVTSGKSYSSNTSTISFYEQNGTYSYSISSTDRSFSSPGGLFVVDGTPVSENIAFTPVLFKVTFQESGLPSDTTWNASMNGANKTGFGQLMFLVSNGTYSYSIGSVAGYSTKDYSGSVAVSGASVILNIAWTQITYPVIITVSGLPSGTSWSATLEGPSIEGQGNISTLTSTSSIITFYEPNGSYSYTVDLPSGYHASSSSGTISISGKSAALIEKSSVSFSELLIVAVIVASLAIISLIVTALLLKRKRDRDLFKRRNMER